MPEIYYYPKDIDLESPSLKFDHFINYNDTILHLIIKVSGKDIEICDREPFIKFKIPEDDMEIIRKILSKVKLKDPLDEFVNLTTSEHRGTRKTISLKYRGLRSMDEIEFGIHISRRKINTEINCYKIISNYGDRTVNQLCQDIIFLEKDNKKLIEEVEMLKKYSISNQSTN